LTQGDFLKDDSGRVVVSKLDEAALRELAEAGGGRYAVLSADSHDLDALLMDRAGVAADTSTADTNADLAASTRWRDRGPWLLLLVLPLAAFAFRRGWLMAMAFAVMLPSPRAEAAVQDLWLRADQQAAAALAEGDAKQAAAVAKSPDWRATASFRAGDYETAAADYAKTQGADGAYNEGNALAKLGRYEDALAAYDRALKIAPDMDDAKANKTAVEEWLKKKPQQKDKSSQKQKSKSGDSKDQKQPSDGDKQDSEKDPQDQQQSGDPSQDQKGEGDDSSKSEQEKGEQKSDQPGSDKDSEKGEADSSQAGTSGDTAEPQTQAGESSGQPTSEQQQALSKAIDKSLASGAKADKNGKPVAAVEEDDATQEKRQALEHLLQRVPDDPGGLLRRKFLLEHQRKQQRGDGGE